MEIVGNNSQSLARLLTVDEAAAMLGLQSKTLRQKILRRTIEYQKIGGAVRMIMIGRGKYIRHRALVRPAARLS